MSPTRHPKRTLSPRLLAGKTVGVVGLGHIGGSIVKRLSTCRPRVTLLGTDTDTRISQRASRYCRWCLSLDQLVLESDIVILAVHVPTILTLLNRVASIAATRTQRSRLVVADTGTIKAPVARAARRHRAAFDFVAMHPLAGSQRPGWDGSTAGLFHGTPAFYWPEGSVRGARLIRELIQLLGANPLRLKPEEHDQFIAMTIGLPHMLAYSAQGLADDLAVPSALRGRSWGSLTRVAASDPAMVAGFLSTNSKSTSVAVRQLERRLARLKTALEDPTGRKVESLLRRWQRV